MGATVSTDQMRTLKLRNHHLSLAVWPEAGRILEIKSLSTGHDVVSWWPFQARSPERVGGIGERTVPEGAPPYAWSQGKNSITLTRRLADGVTLEKTITLPHDSLVFHVSLSVRNSSELYKTITVDQSGAFCPGFGGPCPTDKSGISSSRQRAFLRRPGEPAREISYEVYESVRVERDDLEWAVLMDPVSDDLLAIMPPQGHSVLRTEYHWWLDWSREVDLAPGGLYTADFHFAVTGAVTLPLLVSEHFLAGYVGNVGGATDGSGEIRAYGLDPAAAGNALSVAINAKEFLRDKPLPDSREPLIVPLPRPQKGKTVELEVTLGGKFGRAWLLSGRSGELSGKLDALTDEVRAALDRGEMSQVKAASVLAYRRIAELNSDRSIQFLEPLLEKLTAGAMAVASSPRDPVPFYSPAERDILRRIAATVDLDAAAAPIRAALSDSYDLSIPRFRHEHKGAVALSKVLLEAALYLSRRHDDEIIALFKARFSELTDLWARYGHVYYETIHHGTLLANAIPAYKLASEAGLLSLEREAEVQAMIFDLCAKIRRRGGVQFRLSNWWAMEGAALAYTGALFPYLLEAGDYLSFARESFYWLLVHGTLVDGGFWEMSPSYHMVTLAYLEHIAEALARAGEDCYAADACGRRLVEMADYVKKIAVVPGRLPAFDDSGRDMPPVALLSLAKRFQDPELAWHADAAFKREGRSRGVWDLLVPVEAPAPVPACRGSEVLSASGKLILRTACRGVTFVLDYGPQGGWHGHNDKMSFELYWRDLCLVPDAGCYKYEDALHWQWFKTALAHNTVTLGDLDQSPARGRLVYFREGGGCVSAAAGARTYAGVEHRREVTVTGRSVLVDDFIDGAPRGERLVWRMNSFTPLSVENGSVVARREGVTMTVTPMTEGLGIEIAEVPLMDESGAKMVVTGSQLRLSKPVSHDSERIFVKFELSW